MKRVQHDLNQTQRRTRPRRRVPVPTGLFAFGAALAVLATVAASAAAAPAKFVYETCDSALPAGSPPSAQFTANPGAPFIPFNNCALPEGSIGINETGPTTANFAWWAIGIPATPGGFVEQLTISASACFLGAANNQTYVYEPGWPGNCAKESARVFKVHDSFTPFLGTGAGFNILMNCDGNVGTCNSGPGILARFFAAVEVDPKAPSVSAPQGSLLSGTVIRGHQEIAAEATDKGGGLSRLAVRVNGLPAGQATTGACSLYQVNNLSYSGIVAASPTPCPSSLKGNWTLDTANPPFHDGANTVQVCAADYSSVRDADANETCSAPRAVTVDNSCTESAVAGGEVLTAQFARSHKDSVTVPYNTTTKVTGELANNAGDPISGATICVQMQTQGSRRGPQPVATTTTDANGHYLYKVLAGPNRKIKLGYRHDRFQVARTVRYFAHVKPTLEVSTDHVKNGGEIVLRGKLPGARSAGRVVVLEASALHSDHWYPFHRATTNRGGIFHSRYRFEATTVTTKYRIRAEVPRQRDLPWERGASRPVIVLVRASG